MNLSERALEDINKGRNGENQGIPFSLHKLNDYIPGIQHGTYALWGAFTKEGKSTITRQLYIYDVWDYVKLHTVQRGKSNFGFVIFFQILHFQ